MMVVFNKVEVSIFSAVLQANERVKTHRHFNSTAAPRSAQTIQTILTLLQNLFFERTAELQSP